jgi:hypothetical protein
MTTDKAVWGLAFLLVSPFTSSFFTEKSCLADSYHGTYGTGEAIFIPESNCFNSLSSAFLASSFVTPAPPPPWRLVWVEETPVETTTSQAFSTELDVFLEKSLDANTDLFLEDQHTLALDTSVRLFHRTNSSALLALTPEKARTLDTILPRFWRSYLLPTSPRSFQPVPPEAVEPVKRVLASLLFNPDVAAIVNNISVPQMRSDIRFLTGEDGKSGIVSRHSFAEGSRIAAAWLKRRFEATGASCELSYFLIGFAPNLIW